MRHVRCKKLQDISSFTVRCTWDPFAIKVKVGARLVDVMRVEYIGVNSEDTTEAIDETGRTRQEGR